jgi:hypothetical protein
MVWGTTANRLANRIACQATHSFAPSNLHKKQLQRHEVQGNQPTRRTSTEPSSAAPSFSAWGQPAARPQSPPGSPGPLEAAAPPPTAAAGGQGWPWEGCSSGEAPRALLSLAGPEGRGGEAPDGEAMESMLPQIQE